MSKKTLLSQVFTLIALCFGVDFCAIHSFSYVRVTELPPIWNSAYNMFSKYKYLIVNLIFSRLGFFEWEFLFIAPFPDHCLLVPY